MRDSNRSTPRERGRPIAPLVIVALLIAACGATAPSATVTPSTRATAVPTPSPTPDPHLFDPVTADVLFRALQSAELNVTAYNAGAAAGGEPINLINGAYDGWPLVISEYSSAKALAKARKWKAGVKPKQGEAPFAIKGLNILVEWGPTTGSKPPKPDADQRASLSALIAAIDPLLYPLKTRTIVKITLPAHTPTPAASPSGSVIPSPDPSASPSPTP